jgi:hypothetical protein
VCWGLLAAGCEADQEPAAPLLDAGSAGNAMQPQPDSSSSGTGGMGASAVDSSASDQVDASSSFPDVSESDDRRSTADVGQLETSSEAALDGPADVSSDVFNDGGSESEPPDASSDSILDVVDDGPTVSKICAAGCATTDDCRADASSNLVCDPSSHRCVSCTDDVPCIAGASQWTAKKCAVDGDCVPTYGDYCVDVAGFGYCAFDSTKLGTLSCAGNSSSYMMKKHATTDTVSVCARLTRTCDLRRGTCEGPCTITCVSDGSVCTNTCTVARGGTICNATTKRCECASDNDCASPVSHCNLVTLQCECASANDCAADGGSSARLQVNRLARRTASAANTEKSHCPRGSARAMAHPPPPFGGGGATSPASQAGQDGEPHGQLGGVLGTQTFPLASAFGTHE